MLSRAGYSAELNRYFIRAKTSRNPDARIKNLNIFLADTFDVSWIDGRKERGNSLRSNEPIANRCVSLSRGERVDTRNGEFFLRVFDETRRITQKWSAPFHEKKEWKICKYQMLRTRGRKSFWSPSFFSRYPRDQKYIQSRTRLSFITFHFISLRQSVALCFAVGTNSSSSSSSSF